MSSCTRPSRVGRTTASWLASTVSALVCVNTRPQAGTATSSHTSHEAERAQRPAGRGRALTACAARSWATA